jgi:hypothetical protein
MTSKAEAKVKVAKEEESVNVIGGEFAGKPGQKYATPSPGNGGMYGELVCWLLLLLHCRRVYFA